MLFSRHIFKQKLHRRIDHHILGKTLQIRNHLVKCFGCVRIIIARPCEKHAVRFGKADIQRARQTLILLVAHDANAAVVRSIFGKDLRRRILRAIVDSDEFPILHRLRQDAIQRFTQILLSVIDGQDDGNQRLMRFSLFHP